MKVEDFTSIHPRSFRHCSFELKKGEILGVAGLVGAQRTELMEGIFGLRAHTSGRVWIKGEEVNIRQPRDAIRKSVALLTEDRRATGIMGVLSVADNISIASLDALRKGPIMLDDKKILDLVATNKEKMAIKVPSPKTAIKSLSGGNQQKVLIARWLANNAGRAHPGRADPRHRRWREIRNLLHHCRPGKARARACIMISSEMSEIIWRVCDRVYGHVRWTRSPAISSTARMQRRKTSWLWPPSSRPHRKRQRPISKQGGCLLWKLPRK